MGQGRSKKMAKRQAAELMLERLEQSGVYDRASSNTKTEQGGTDSLHIDADDNSNFVWAIQNTAKLTSSLDCTVSDLWKDIEMIEEDDANEDTFYNLFSETISSVGTWDMHHLSDTHCILHVYDTEKNVVLTSFGSGDNIFSAMKSSVLNAYRQLMALIHPLTGKDPHLLHRIQDRPLQADPMET